MKFVYLFAFLFLAIYLLVTAAVGFGTVAASVGVAHVLNISALISGILFLILFIKHVVDRDNCCHTHEVEKK